MLYRVFFLRLFHSVGPACDSDLAAKVCFLMNGTCSRLSPLDLRLILLSCFSFNNFMRYEGARPLRHVYTRTSILNSILALIGSQCSSHKQSLALSM